MTRQERLNNYLDSMKSRRFKPGTHDCGLFVAGWVKALTGKDYGKPYRGQYKSIQEGKTALQDEGFPTHVEYVASILSETPPAMAQTGDIAIVEGDALGIVASDRIFVLRPDGLGHVSRIKAERTFTV